MSIEIERKFLVTSDAWRDQAHAVIDMAQGYLNDHSSVASGAQRASVRVRIEGDQARLNIKSLQIGRSRQEFDYLIPLEEGRALLALCVGGLLEKRRHLVKHGAHVWEIDEFGGQSSGLVVAEVELQAEDEAIARPDWLGREVTELPRYYNLALAAYPYAQWTDAERAASDAPEFGEI